jgi:hypothetical protein
MKIAHGLYLHLILVLKDMEDGLILAEAIGYGLRLKNLIRTGLSGRGLQIPQEENFIRIHQFLT